MAAILQTSRTPPRKPQQAEAKILFQKYFKSVGPRTYAAQLKQAGNGNHFLVLTEGKRDEKSADVRKTRLFVFSEDFDAFFDLLQSTRDFSKANPMPAAVRDRRKQFWSKQRSSRIEPRSERSLSQK